MISGQAEISKLKRKGEDISFGSNCVYLVPPSKLEKRNDDDKTRLVRTIKSDVNLAEGGSYFNTISDRYILDQDFGDVESPQIERRVFITSDDENSNLECRDKSMVPVQLLQGNKDIDLTLCSIKSTEQDGLPVEIALNTDINFSVPPVSLSSAVSSVSHQLEVVVDPQDHSYPKCESASNAETSSDPVTNMWVTSKADKAQLRNSGHTWKTGKWTQDEIELLKENIGKYCKDHKIEDVRQIIYNASKDERPRFYPTIATGLNRPVFAVYRRVKRMYDSQNYKGKYSQEEVKKLKDLHAKYGKDWSLIGQVMGRSSDSVKDRCRLVISDEKRPGKWSADEELRLAQAVYEMTGVEEGTSVTSNICWSTVAEKVGTRTEKQCRGKWLNYLNWKKSNGEKWTKTEDAVLLERIAASRAETEQDIDWDLISTGWKSSRSPQWLRIKWWSLKQFYLGDSADSLNISLGDLLQELAKLIVKQINTWDQSKRVRKPALETQTDKFLTKKPATKVTKLRTEKKISIKPKVSKQTKPVSLLYVDNIGGSTVVSQDGSQDVVLVTDPNGEVQGQILLDKDTNEDVTPDESESNAVDVSQTSAILSEELEVDAQSTSEDVPLNATLQLAPTSSPGVFLVQNSDSNNPLMLVLSEDMNSVDFTPEFLSYINSASSKLSNETSEDSDVISNLESCPNTATTGDEDDIASSHHSDVITTSDVLVYQETGNDDDSKNPILGCAMHEVVTGANENEEDTCFIQSSSPLQGTLLEGTDLATSSLRMDVSHS